MRALVVALVIGSMCVGATALAQPSPTQESKTSGLIDLGFTEDDSPTPPRAVDKKEAASASTTSSYIALSWEGAYEPAPDALIAQVRSSGLTAEAITTLDDVETPNAVRIMILDAASARGRAARTAEKLLRAWSRGGRSTELLTVDGLSAERLLMIGYLAARASPDKLEPLGGDSEVEKLTPMTLLMAATSRRRGDMTSRVVLALVKAQQALVSPDESLCAPYMCMKTAVEPFYQEWSVHPERVCAFALAGDTSGRGLDPDDPLAFCGEHARQDNAPVFVEQARQEDRERQAASSSGSATASGGSASGLPTVTIQQELAMIELAVEQLKQERARMSGLEGVIVDQMIAELERQQQLIEAHLKGSPSGARVPVPVVVPLDPLGIGKNITF